jgi:peptidoglycan/xylan/chitin deacetylase (PgdA/CDA1 family)
MPPLLSIFRQHLIACLTLTLLLLFTSPPTYAIDVTITLDGIPAHGELPPHVTRLDIANQMIRTLKKHQLQTTYGFMVGNLWVNDNDEAVLRHWLAAGNALANHSFSHPDLAEMTVADYLDDLQKTDTMLSKLIPPTAQRYFRYPYLSEGETLEKRDAVLQWLTVHHYQVAPVTIDFSDYVWNEAYVRCANKQDKQAIEWLKKTYLEQAVNGVTIAHLLSEQVVGRDVKNILLLHFGVFEALMLDELIAAYQQAGVTFITLPDALTDEIYQVEPDVINKVGYTYLHKMRIAKGLDSSEQVKQLAKSRPINELNRLCK